MIGILIIAHGNLGENLRDCAQHVLGKAPEQLGYIAVSSQDDPALLLPKAQALLANLNTGDGVLVLSDMYGATPCNLVSKLVQPNLVEGVAGLNLPMLVRAITYRNEPLATVVEKAITGGREGVVHFNRDSCKHYQMHETPSQ